MALVIVLVRNEQTKEEKEVTISRGCGRRYALARARVESGFYPDPVEIVNWQREGKAKRHHNSTSKALLKKRRQLARREGLEKLSGQRGIWGQSPW